MVFQNYALFPNLTVAGNIGFGMTVTGASRKEIDARVHELEMIHLPRTPVITPISSLEVNNNAWRWRAPWPFDRACFCWTSRSAPWTHRSASLCEQEIRSIQQQLRITTVYVTHDQDEALSLLIGWL